MKCKIGKTEYVWVFKVIYFLFRDQEIRIVEQRADEIHLSTDAWQLAIVSIQHLKYNLQGMRVILTMELQIVSCSLIYF